MMNFISAIDEADYILRTEGEAALERWESSLSPERRLAFDEEWRVFVDALDQIAAVVKETHSP